MLKTYTLTLSEGVTASIATVAASAIMSLRTIFLFSIEVPTMIMTSFGNGIIVDEYHGLGGV